MSKMTIEPQQAKPVSKMDGTSLLSTPWPFWTYISTSGNRAITRSENPGGNSVLWRA